MSDCRFGVSPVNYSDPDPEFVPRQARSEEFFQSPVTFGAQRKIILDTV